MHQSFSFWDFSTLSAAFANLLLLTRSKLQHPCECFLYFHLLFWLLNQIFNQQSFIASAFLDVEIYCLYTFYFCES